MIFLLLLQTFLSEPTLQQSVVQDLAHLEYDSLHIDANYSKLADGEWIKTKPFRAGNNLIKLKSNGRYKLIPIRIRLFKHVWKTNRYIKKSTPITTLDVVKEFHDISFIKDPLLDFNSPLIASKSIRRNHILTKNNTRNEFDCKFGESLFVEYVIHGLRIKLEAKALEDAYLGERITVKTKQGKIEGVLVKKGTVRYEKL